MTPRRYNTGTMWWLRDLIRSRPWLFLLAAVALLAGAINLIGDPAWKQLRRERQKLAEIQTTNGHLADDNSRLNEDINALGEHGKDIERSARENLGLAKPNEVVIRIPGKK